MTYLEKPDDMMVAELKPNAVVQTLRDGSKRIVPYLKDENGEEYVEMLQPHQFPVGKEAKP
jgi:hypothetical protein